jgi:putative ABC transport system permease protein
MVDRISPVIFRHMRINGRLVQLRAAPLADWGPIHHLALLEGRWPGPSGEAAVGEGAARANGWQVGTTLRIYGSDFRVAGVFRSPGTIFASVWLPLEAAQNLFAPRRSSQLLLIQAAAGVDAEAMRLRLQNDESLTGNYAVFFEENYTRRNTQALRDLANLMRIVGGIALLAISVGTYNATTLSLVERGRETGILRAIGFGQSAVRLFLLVRGLLLGLVSYLTGLAAAVTYAQVQASAAPLFIFGFPFIYQIDLTNAATGLVWILLLAPSGAWLAACQLQGVSVAEILKRPA